MSNAEAGAEAGGGVWRGDGGGRGVTKSEKKNRDDRRTSSSNDPKAVNKPELLKML